MLDDTFLLLNHCCLNRDHSILAVYQCFMPHILKITCKATEKKKKGLSSARTLIFASALTFFFNFF